MEYSGVSNETKAFHTRTTASGRVLRYELTMLQQPERARACGQGAKSSTDRRPVDPPPIIELKIKEGENGEEDVTFKMNANYVLFASLEQARPIAKARGHQEKSTPTVLTGSPAAGMAYLERPTPAGYFIFSDLSVRHEGMYRLNFSLFEELKDSADADKNPDPLMEHPDAGALIYRMDVRSLPFTVHSAKKFPGLTPSTDLSRTVAEQGCRVRIRRDVRMRRREQKPGNGGAGGDWDSYEDATAEARARASATPDSRMHTPHHSANYMDPVPRPRSASNASQHSSYQAAIASRRTSMQDLQQPQYPHASYPSNAPMTPSGYAHGVPYSPQPYQAPSLPSAYAQPQQPTVMAPPSYQPASHHTAHSAATQYYPYGSGSEAGHAQHNAYEQRQYAAPSHQYSAPPAPSQAPAHHYSPYASHHAPATPAHQAQPYAPQYGHVSATPTASTAHMPAPQRSSSTLPPLNTTFNNAHALEPASPHHTTSESMTPAAKPQKRSYDRVFHDVAQRGSLRNGERPTLPSPTHPVPYVPGSGMPDSALDAGDDSGDECDPSDVKMKYRRADGRQIRRALPLYPQ